METTLTFWERVVIFFGFGYLVNHLSKEIHRVSNKHENCHLDIISSKHSEYITRSMAEHLIRNRNYNGCRWCWKSQDNG